MSTWKVHRQYEFYFITSTIVNWLPVFVDKVFFSIITDSLQYCIENKGLNIHGYVIMLNHIHLLVSCDKNLSAVMKNFKSFTSRRISSLAEKKNMITQLKIFRKAANLDKKSLKYKVWQTGFHPIAIKSEKFYLQKLNYLHRNPVRKGYVSEPEHWYYSSARNYAGLNDYPLEVDIL